MGEFWARRRGGGYTVGSLFALNGRLERPRDGVADYCKFLGESLAQRGVKMEVARLDCDELGWINVLRELRRKAVAWRGSWVVVHYTALAWSRRGFPLGFLIALAVLRRGGARCAVLFHEYERQWSGSRLRDRIRGAVQDWVIRRSYRMADRAIFTIPIENVAWIPRDEGKAAYVPIGANIPQRILDREDNAASAGCKTIAVFCVSLSANRQVEIADLARAAELVRDSGTAARFVILGKGSAEARPEIEHALKENGVDVCVLGMLTAEQIADTLAAADVLLYLCGPVRQTRGSVLAGVACGLPIVGYSDGTRAPIDDAGVELIPYRDGQALAAALLRVLQDDELRAELRRRSMETQQREFGWDSIAERYIRALDLPEAPA